MFSASFNNINYVLKTFWITGLIGVLYLVWAEQYVFIFIGILLGFFLLHFSNQVALHRYFSHKTFETSKFWHIVLCFSTVLVGATPVHYALPHLAHHAFTDTDKDPHNPDLGIWRVLFPHLWNTDHLNIRLIRNYHDYWIQFIQKWYMLILLIFFILLALVDLHLIFSYGIAALFNKISGLVVNYTGHIRTFPGNYRNFDTNDNSCNNLITGAFFGEWHNNHHHMPRAWNEQVKWWEADIPGIIIRVIKK
jgi:stearoyl-CoA desaturase (delta-9 desaturase)